MFAFLLCPETRAANESVTEKPVAYNIVPEAAGAAYREVRAVYGAQYAIVDVREDDADFQPPRLLTWSQPAAVDADNEPLRGEATVRYVITSEGAVVLPRIVHATSNSLAMVLLDALAKSRFRPARYRNQPVDVIAGQQISVNPGIK